MRVIVSGGRDFKDYSLVCGALEPMRDYIERIVCGMARGADLLGKRWAEYWGIPVDEFPAEWDTYRNRQMATAADALVAFWDGKSTGTKDMIDVALEYGLEVHVYRYKA